MERKDIPRLMKCKNLNAGEGSKDYTPVDTNKQRETNSKGLFITTAKRDKIILTKCAYFNEEVKSCLLYLLLVVYI